MTFADAAHMQNAQERLVDNIERNLASAFEPSVG